MRMISKSLTLYDIFIDLTLSNLVKEIMDILELLFLWKVKFIAAFLDFTVGSVAYIELFEEGGRIKLMQISRIKNE